MKHFRILLIAFLTLVLLTGCAQASRETTPILARFSASDMNGNPVNETVLANAKLNMINVWGTFCSPCISEMPDLGMLAAAYEGELQVIGIVIDAADQKGNPIPQTLETAHQIVESTGADYLHILPSPSLYDSCLKDIQSIPVTFFVNETGQQVGESYIGAKSREQWERIIIALLEDRKE